MTKQEMIDRVNQFIKTTYSKQIAEMNANVIITPVIEGGIDAPGFKITSGGGTLVKAEGQDLNPPAELKVELSKKSVIQPTYRIMLPFDEVSFACTNEGYMKTMFDFVMSQAVSNYNYTFGGPEVTRYGVAYLYLPQVEDFRDDFLITFKGQYAQAGV